MPSKHIFISILLILSISTVVLSAHDSEPTEELESLELGARATHDCSNYFNGTDCSDFKQCCNEKCPLPMFSSFFAKRHHCVDNFPSFSVECHCGTDTFWFVVIFGTLAVILIAAVFLIFCKICGSG
ncbi:hypothetical protein M3Y97_01093500 [Aphelenchoides bicaudatus]|nr:hypothetical protein M3Y97_01093500 [Aphelenchoides bicaudatus]